jgi:hypothetical protein
MSDVMNLNQEDLSENVLLWTKEQEELLKDWCDIANCFRWMHEQSSFKYKRINNQIALPVIVLSTLTGTANFGMSSLIPQPSQKIASAVIGGINIFCGVLTTIQTYFQYAENTEAHSTASKAWSKFQRIVGIELAIDRVKRKKPNEFLKYCIEEYNKLKESSPVIPPDVAHQFRVRFKRVHTVYKPDVYEHLGNTLTYNDYLSRTPKAAAASKTPRFSSATIQSDQDQDQDLEEDEINSLRPTATATVRKFTNVGDEIDRRVQSAAATATATESAKQNKAALSLELQSLKPNIKELVERLEFSRLGTTPNPNTQHTTTNTNTNNNAPISLIRNI